MEESIKSYRMAVCDDEEAIRNVLKKYIEEIFQENHINMHVESYENPIKLLEQVQKEPKRYQIILLDVDMPEMNGIELGKKIKEVSEHILITFVTAHEKYALKAFEVDAFQYMLKPLEKDRLRKILRKFYHLFMKINKDELKYITVNDGERYTRVFYKDIVYFEKTKNKVRMVCEARECAIYVTIKELKETLGEDPFVQCHQGIIVHKEKITEFKNNKTLILNDTHIIPVSRSHRKVIKDIFTDLLRG